MLLAAALVCVVPSCTSDYGDIEVQGSTSAGGATSNSTGALVSTSSTTGGDAGASGPGGSGAAGGSSTSGIGGMGAIGGAGGSGGMPSLCGDGHIDPNEECDGGGVVAGCDASCKIVCNKDHEVLDPNSHHCYYFDPLDMGMDWTAARTFCQTTWGGGDLLILETMGEYQFLLPQGMQTPPVNGTFFWTGGNDQITEGVYVWWDNSPITYPTMMPPWMDSQPNGVETDDCLVWRADAFPATEGLGDVTCGGANHPFCERAPPGT